MSWYKKIVDRAALMREHKAVSVTSAEFGAMTWREKQSLSWRPVLTPEVQMMFFAESYENKGMILQALTQNKALLPEIYPLFFKQNYEGKKYVLESLAENSSIPLETQLLFFKPEYWVNKFHALYHLVYNANILPEAQRLFFTEEYPHKNRILAIIVRNPSFLQNLNSGQWLQIKNAARGGMRLQVLKKRLEQIVGVP